AADGRPLWSYESSQELRGAPALGEGVLLLGEQGGVFSVIDPENGKRLTGGGAGGPVNTPAISEGSAFFSSWDGSVQRVKLKGNVPQWKANVEDPVTTSPEVGAGKVVVGTARGNIAAIDATSGKVLWQFNTQGGDVSAKPVVREGMVFAGGGQGVLSILDAGTGRLLSTFTTGAGINGTPAFEGGVLYLGSGDGVLYAIM
ncbi:MAG: PQQ-like beta-propeller repeat protein, partial [Fretibacterium sp.]|nr:PQQ-like beta-propeller repeat protein [Fretibacterium sp.]